MAHGGHGGGGFGDDAEVQLAAALQGIPLEQAALMRRAQRAQGLMGTPMPQGQAVGRVFKASSPLEHLAAAFSRFQGGREAQAVDRGFGDLSARAGQAAQAQAKLQAARRQEDIAREQGNTDREFGLKERGLERQAAAQAEAERAARAREAADRAKLEQDAWAVIPDPVYGGFVRYNKKTGQTEPVGVQGNSPAPGPTGASGPTPPATPPGFKMTEPQAKAFSAVSRIREARKMMEEAGYPSGLGGRKDAWATGASGGALGAITPQEAASEEGQRYFTAGRNLIAALLRKESGAAITKDEWEQLGPLYIPMPWDDDATRANKLRMLDVMEQSAVMESGPAAASHLTREKASAAPAAAAGSGPARIQTKEQRDALPPGTQYVGPDGVTYTKR